MAKRNAKRCPCGGGIYKTCCERYHRGDDAPDAEALMRSRFSAFALGLGEYLFETLHPAHALRARAKDEVVRELSRARQKTRYQALIVHEHEPGETQARVLFTARVFERGVDKSFSELSDFERVDGAWRYRDGLTSPRSAATIESFLEMFG